MVSTRPRTTSADVDVVVVSYNSGSHLRSCLEGLTRCSGVTLLIVDNASSDGSLSSVANLPVTVLAQPDNLGFAHACNVGWRAGASPFVLFLNPDAEVDCGALAVLTEVLLADASVGIVGPKIVNDDQSIAFSQRRFPTLRSTFSQALFLQRLFPEKSWSDEVVRDAGEYLRSHDVDWLSGACLLIRRELLERIGGWDEAFFLYSEDTEICRAAWSSGYRVRYEATAAARHAGGASAPRSGLLGMLARSRIAYARKNYPALIALGHRAGIALEALTHMVVCRGGLAQRRGHARALLAAFRPAERASIPYEPVSGT
jgi:N-acetylglucosaminyl-diphospho-decaprenol L-rhamnosyltransferase